MLCACTDSGKQVEKAMLLNAATVGKKKKKSSPQRGHIQVMHVVLTALHKAR